MTIKLKHVQYIAKVCMFLIFVSMGIGMLKENVIPLLSIDCIDIILDKFLLLIYILILSGAIVCACFALGQTFLIVGFFVFEIILAFITDRTLFTYILNHIKQIMIVIFSAYILSSIQIKPREMYRIFLQSAYFLFICGVISTLIFRITVGKIYCMPYANCLVFPAIVFLNEGIRKEKVFNVLLSFLSVFLIFIYGSRGAMVIYVVFLLYKILFFIKSHLQAGSLGCSRINGKLAVKYCLMSFAFLAVIYFYGRKLLLNSRTFQLLIDNTLFRSSGRIADFWLPVIKGIKNNWIIGGGIFSDRLFLYSRALNVWITDNLTPDGLYTHNFFLEILYQLGVFRGCIIIVILLTLMLCVKKRTKTNRYNNDIFYILLCMNVMLLYSSSYLNWEYFWILIGFSIRIIKERGEIHNEKKVVG